MVKFLSFFFNDTATTEIYTLSLHDALPILLTLESGSGRLHRSLVAVPGAQVRTVSHSFRSASIGDRATRYDRSEEHTSELQSRQYLVCRLLLEKKKYTLRQL